MENIKNKVIIITGASSGIGEATVKKLAKTGAKVMMFARREDLLKSIKSELVAYDVEYKVGDVTSLLDMKELVSYTLEKFGKIDVMFHNAGIMPMGPLASSEEKEVKKWTSAVNVNIMGVVNGLAACLPIMVEQKFGHMIAMDSVAGHLVYPNSAVYCGTKYAVRAIMEGVRQEHLEDNIRSSIVSPGIVETELINSVGNPDIESWIAGEVKDRTTSLSAEDVAEAVAYILSTPENVSISEVLMRSSKHAL
ncbi:NADP-dependent 3-hydroxy acid dehydrogenase YdfG [Enterococcus rotai]|uniref:Oxidoreductase n=1 Tax=Enterococcus rotai TaxID=118060 RepID=A0A0U2LVM1_9ENTE|nr:SDR family oxidoreductase [Enterococcus rotai]ALS36837.1 hypothetical protein ATZ35_06610 [Enterococcus rotai]